ncbi:putative T6SS immunity periplasmic lipoprotein [Morganella psychrotolerans]|uniref:DUF7480 domain-containing protein n=1 Tax=Morganella psychrotolerans TaxID=368603 RepID=A0A1B8H346_9GAMM|nr:putative T6SS immunity periplasmic lipoprotein [Morganella psychrotolerans]OBU03504.1 hypothetical protein AYY17_11100 [Morganella psychrotolerans]
MAIFNKKTGYILLMMLAGLSAGGCVYKPDGSHSPARVIIVSNQVCIIISPDGDEKLARLDIDEIGSENKRLLTHTFTPQQDVIGKHRCVSTLNYPFRSGKSYTALITVESDIKRRLQITPVTRNFDVRFQLTEYFGQLRATEY